MAKQTEIFENNEAVVEEPSIVESDEIAEIPEEIAEENQTIHSDISDPIVKVDKRKGKRTKVISEEQRKILLDNLSRGRAKALETRRRNAQLKKIAKEEKISENEQIILKALSKKKEKSSNNDELLKKIADLELKLEQKANQKPIEKIVEKVKYVEKIVEPKSEPKVVPKSEPKVESPPPVTTKKDMSKKELMKLMKSMR